MATTFPCFLPSSILCSAASNHRKPSQPRRKSTSSSSANWWTPLFGWSSDLDYINNSGTNCEPAPNISEPAESETAPSRSRFPRGCFTEEKAKQLRRKTMETVTFHDVMYHSAIASRLASDISERRGKPRWRNMETRILEKRIPTNRESIVAGLLVLVCATCHVALSLTDGLLPNGNFELGPKPWQMNGTEVMGNNAIPYWETSGFVEYIKSGQKQGDMVLIVPEGSFAVRLGNDASVKQKVKVINGMFYSLAFSAARTCAQEEKLNVSVSPNSESNDWGMLPMQTMTQLVAQLLIQLDLRLCIPPKRTKANMLKNGNFEEGPYVFPNTSWGVIIPPNIEDDHSPLPGWMVESLKAVKYIDSEHFAVPEGKRAVELVAGKESAIAQVVKTTPGKVYDLAFAVGDANDSCEGSMMVEAFAGKVALQVPYESKGTGGFKRANLRFTAVTTHTRVRFLSTYYTMKSDNSGSLCGPVIDDVKLLGVRYPQRA
ncbi:hypothetical protein F0562_024623 [Nyssa sinensis]|uniref:DUF642 domain-containing protein n=1 Tax=Nyssa sinensis TaxID=561372 RepID=A0A5J5BCN6_9ASTE|nr:hypothetical protein F0562_024623 [Nyssa sinensis]